MCKPGEPCNNNAKAATQPAAKEDHDMVEAMVKDLLVALHGLLDRGERKAVEAVAEICHQVVALDKIQSGKASKREQIDFMLEMLFSPSRQRRSRPPEDDLPEELCELLSIFGDRAHIIKM